MRLSGVERLAPPNPGVFVHAKVFFSIGGQHFTGEPVQFSYMPDTVMENARDVTIKLHHRVGRYVQIHLYFALRWIMLSEISFNSANKRNQRRAQHLRTLEMRFREIRCIERESNSSKLQN
uniref:Discoidin domain-containing protein n=1 Tax=Anopheles stephensi TaxID=30069 RepID=A0A182YSD4_ANOST